MKTIIPAMAIGLTSLTLTAGPTKEILAAAGAAAGTNPATQAAYSFGGLAIGTLLDGHLEKKKDQKEFELYMLGRYQEAYIRAYAPWYQATLNPRTDRPTAFDGLWAMNIGVPGAEHNFTPVPANIPLTKQVFEQTIKPNPIQPKPQPDKLRAASATTARTTPQNQNGIQYISQEVIYPRLPKR